MRRCRTASRHDPSTRPCRSPRRPGCSACTRTRSGPGATPAGSATTGSTRAATGATAWATCSGSSPRPSRVPPVGTAPTWPGAGHRPANGGSRRGRTVPAGRGRRAPTTSADPLDAERHRLDLAVAAAIARLGSGFERDGRAAAGRRPGRPRRLRPSPRGHLGAARRAARCRAPSRAADPAEPSRLVDLPRDLRHPRRGARRRATTDRGAAARVAHGRARRRARSTAHRRGCPAGPARRPAGAGRRRSRAPTGRGASS